MDALRMQMGDAAFWAGLRRYTQTHAGSGVTSADFERTMQGATTVDLRPMFAQWVGARSQ